MSLFDNLLSMEDIGYFIFMEEQEKEDEKVHVDLNDDFVGVMATQNDDED